MNWLFYLAEANAYLVAFYLVYSLLLAKETHYQLSRAYLLLSSLAAFALPLVQLNFLKPTVYIDYSAEAYVPAAAQATPLWQTALFYGYLAGVCVVLALFVLKLIQLKRLTRSSIRIDEADHHLIKLEESNTAFSFFNYLFIGAGVADEKLVIKHELVHIRQKHSADIIFTELLKAINWFNPVIYLLQNSIRTLHEYIADEQAAQAASNTIDYASFLVDNAYGHAGPAITHSFFNHNLLKKRIIMLDQKRSGSLARLKYLVAVPLCAALLGESTLGFSKPYGVISIGQQKIKVDTAKKPKVKVTNVRLAPPPPKGKTVITNVHTISSNQKGTGKVTVTDVRLNPNAPKPDISKVKFPPPRNPKTGKVKIDPRGPKPDVSKVKFPPPPPPVPSAKKTASNLSGLIEKLHQLENQLQQTKPKTENNQDGAAAILPAQPNVNIAANKPASVIIGRMHYSLTKNGREKEWIITGNATPYTQKPEETGTNEPATRTAKPAN